MLEVYITLLLSTVQSFQLYNLNPSSHSSFVVIIITSKSLLQVLLFFFDNIELNNNNEQGKKNKCPPITKENRQATIKTDQ